MKKTAFIRNPKIQANNNLGDGEHLWVVISDPDPDNNVLIVNVTGFYTKRADTSCRLFKGDHSFINKDSVIAYNYAQEVSTFKIKREESLTTIILREEISENVLKRIQNGAKRSPLLPEGLLTKYEQYF